MMILRAPTTNPKKAMYLIDTNVISEVRKGSKANKGVRDFFKQAINEDLSLFISVVTLGELRRGIELIRHRGDLFQANRLESWLLSLLHEYENFILNIDETVAQLWGRLRVPHSENALDKQIAATALVYDLTLVSRNLKDFQVSGLRMINPFKS